MLVCNSTALMCAGLVALCPMRGAGSLVTHNVKDAGGELFWDLPFCAVVLQLGCAFDGDLLLLGIGALENVTVGFRGAIAGRAVWCCCAVFMEECFPKWQPFIYELEQVCSASDVELFPLMLEGFPVYRVESLFGPLELVVAMHSKFGPVVVVSDCFIVLLIYDHVPVEEIF
jgi:hypothetical protein